MLENEKGSLTNTTITRRRTIMCRGLAMVVFVLAIVGALFVPAVSLAQTTEATKNAAALQKAAGVNAPVDLVTILGRIINIALGFVGIILLVLMLYAGYLWMTSGGEMEKVNRARLMIRNAIIGLLIIVSAFAIVNFVLGLLTGGGVGGGGVTGTGAPTYSPGFPSAAGSLGNGIIESHVPERDATQVPRNTAIIVTFKEPIKIASFIKDYNDNGTPADLTDDPASSTTIGINSDVIKIYPTGQPTRPLTTAQVRVRFTADRKTFVMRPTDYLGSPTVSTGYTVELVPGLSGVLREDGSAAFTGAFSAGYKWQFEVSTVVDTTPPRLISVIPTPGGSYAPNIIVQMNFSEPIDPTSASGLWQAGAGFSNIQLSAVPIATPSVTLRPDGEFKISNGYATVEFVSALSCGMNSCGRQVFCLPYNATISVLVKAASLGTNPPQAQLTSSGYDGITDVAGNSFDGNGDGLAQGAPTDNDDRLSFGTSDQPNLTPPTIRQTVPQAGDRVGSSNIPLDQAPYADFDSPLQSSTVNSDSALIRSNETAASSDTFWWQARQDFLTSGGTVATSGDAVVGGRVRITHRLYLPSTSTGAVAPQYYPVIYSGIQNVYQNCFNPASSLTCHGGPYCCDDRTSGSVCPYAVPPTP